MKEERPKTEDRSPKSEEKMNYQTSLFIGLPTSDFRLVYNNKLEINLQNTISWRILTKYQRTGGKKVP